MPKGEDKPALGIVAHTRKPHAGERRTGGTGLLHLLSGSLVLGSVPRCVWIVVRGSEDETDSSVVVFNPKNNNGLQSGRTAWVRKNGLFEPLPAFDWQQFDKPPEERKIIRPEHIKEALEGKGTIAKAAAAEALMTITEMGRSACYDAFKADGKFGHLFTISAHGVTWK